jgi:hypothetical protein
MVISGSYCLYHFFSSPSPWRLKLCGGGFITYGHCLHTLFPTAKCELKTIEEVDALAEPSIKKHEEQLKKRKF